MIKGYYFITDSSLSIAGNLSDVKNAAEAGVRIIQYRNKSADTRELYREAAALKAGCRNSLFLINDRIDIALAVNADGAHLGQNDMPYAAARRLLGADSVIGITVHTKQEALDAENAGADYVAAAPVFETSTKSDSGQPTGLMFIKELKAILQIPVIAIGGINLANAAQAVKAGADGICAISAVVTKPDIKKEIQKFQNLFQP